jgi:crotonobetainyl-CoA:carnitine CoA-transferase CaiB-like acyl-CoA transferase
MGMTVPSGQEPTVLSGLCVLETGNAAARFAGYLLRGLGAEVTRLEAHGDAPGASDYLDAGKQRVTLDLATGEGKASFRDLVSKADVLIETFAPGYLAALGLAYADLSAVNPGLAMASLTPFGQDGPRAADSGSELVAQAVGGWLSVTGEADRPVRLPGSQAHFIAALFAVNSILLALRQRRQTGRGQHLDISLQECAAATLDHVLPRYAADGTVAGRQGSLHWNSAFRVFPCADGHVLLSIHREWDTLVGWMEAEGAAADLTDPRWCDEAYRNEHIDHVIEVITGWTRLKTAADFVKTGQLMRFPWAKVADIHDLPADPHLAAREFFSNFAERGKLYPVPGAPFRMSAASWLTGGDR